MGDLTTTFTRKVRSLKEILSDLLGRIGAGSPVPQEPQSEPDIPATTAEPLRANLDNGMKTAVQYFPDRRKFHRAILVIKGGSGEDPPGKEGTAHFLEHVLMDPAMINDIKKRGGDIQFMTSARGITIDMVMPSGQGNGQYMLDTLRQIVTNRNLPPELVESERKRILNEIGISADNPGRRLTDEGVRFMYSNPAVFMGNLGSKENVKSIAREDLSEYMERHFNASNMALVLRVPHMDDTTSALGAIGNTFAGLPTGALVQPGPIVYTPYERRQNHGTQQLYFSYNMNVDPDAASYYTQNVYAHYLQLLTQRDVIHAGSLYQAEAETIYEPDRVGVVLVSGNILPEDAGKVGPAFAEMIGKTAHTIEPELFAVAKKRAMEDFLGGEDEWLWGKNPRNMAAALAFEDKSESFWDSCQGFEKVKPEDLMAFTRDKVMKEKPSLYADGDSGLLTGPDEFVALMHKAALPDAKAALSREFQPTVA